MAAADRNPQRHTQAMKARLQETVTHLREDVEKVDDAQFKAMFETAAEVLTGLIKAFGDYEKKNEAAWRKSA
jgi:ferric iron reductase protein FhuF